MAVLIAEQIAVGVHQCATGIARIDGGIGLDEVLEGVDAEMIAAQRRDDAHGHGLADAERIADCQHHITDRCLINLRQRDGRQIRQVDLDHGEIGFRIGAHHFGRGLATISNATSISSAASTTWLLVRM